MKKTIFTFTLILSVFLIPQSNGYTQEAITLDRAIRNSVDDLVSKIPQNTIVIIPNFVSPYKNLSEHIIDKMMDRFIAKKVKVVDRSHLEISQRELVFQMTGVVNEATARSIGNTTGAQTIIAGSINQVNDDLYQFRVRAVSIETTEVHGTFSANVSKKSVDMFFQTDKDSGDMSSFGWLKKHAKRNTILVPQVLLETDSKNTNICYELGVNYSFLPFTSVGINAGMAFGLDGFYIDTNYFRTMVSGTMGLVLPISSRIKLFGDGLIEAASGDDSGIHFGYAAGISTRLYKSFGIEIRHKGIWYENNKKMISLGLGFIVVF